MKKGGRITLVLGGARSGKSTYALKLAGKMFRRPLFAATAEAVDDEMAERIAAHKKSRGRRWRCIEEPLDLAGVLAGDRRCDGILLDCVTVWLSNVLVREGEKAAERRERQFLAGLKKARVPVIVVSNEVGMGIVPESKLGRRFRDLAGWLNQALAAAADEVVFVAAGLPVRLKGGGCDEE